ncbi:Fic family protein [Pseudomonas protegens]|uniref:Fic family protein n=1 Tax=Pseudomonas protegens TaxID=380021 RepID=UPI0029374541|nr:Fic family protein [Pseudomonas protegens]WOE79961.1 Fic family protein [Pseudomonas protegens]
MTYSPPTLPLTADPESKAILRKLARAHQALAELKGVADSMPNQRILIDTLALQEAKDSSAIENIITTDDDLYRSDSLTRQFVSLAAKEVHNYATALKNGFVQVQRTGLLTSHDILTIQACIEGNDAGFRKLPGTSLKNQQTGAVVYTPPQHPDAIVALMDNLEAFINDETLCDWDPLTKMAVIHHQFESIHPFYDGNGRTGRIINVLYLVQQGLLSSPVLYLSRYINQHKADYYRLLQAVRDQGAWEDWLLFMLNAVEQTAQQTTELTHGIKRLMQQHKERLRKELPKIYSQDLVNNLFHHPYTKIEFVMDELQVHRNTASRYLEQLVNIGLLSKHKLGKDNFYLNDALFQLLLNVGQPQTP